MRESDFIEQNKEKWLEFEKLFAGKDKNPEKLNELFVKVTDDLSYARSFYSNRSVRVYLNGLAQKIFSKIYRSKKFRISKFIDFWKDDLPLLVYHSRKEFLVSFLLFAFSFAIGWFSSTQDPEFVKTILGEGYVQMTIENIKNGDPMAVYKSANQMDMVLGITVNNLMVAFRTFALGIFFAIGAIAIMLYNGIMVGTFQHFFYEKGLFLESFLTIWVHGTLEISAIIIAGAAGIVMGKGLVFPGTYNRIQSLLISAKAGIKIMLGIFPIIVLAGIIESFLTRYTDTPNAVRALFIIICAAFILFYFVIYPFLKARSGREADFRKLQLNPDKPPVFTYDKIRGNEAIFNDSFKFYKKFFNPIFFFSLIGSLIFAIAFGIIHQEDFALNFNYQYFGFDRVIYKLFSYFREVSVFFSFEKFPVFFIAISILMMLVLSLLAYLFKTDYRNSKPKSYFESKKYFSFLGKNVFSCLFFGALFALPFLALEGWVFLSLQLLPFIMLSYLIAVIEKKNPLAAINKMFGLIGNGFWKLMGVYYVAVLVSLIFMFINTSTFLWGLFDMLNWNFELSSDSVNMMVIGFFAFISVLGILLLIPISFIGVGFYYFSQKERNEANNLFKAIDNIKVKRLIKGIEREQA